MFREAHYDPPLAAIDLGLPRPAKVNERLAMKSNPAAWPKSFAAGLHRVRYYPRTGLGDHTPINQQRRPCAEVKTRPLPFVADRMLYEGACDLSWPEYFAFRKKHKAARG